MSMMGTLAKMAIGVAIAKGASSMMKGAQGSAGTGGLFGGANSPQGQASSGGGLGGMLGGILGGGGQAQQAGAGGGLGGLLESLSGGSSGAQAGGGSLDSLLSGQGGALGGLMESMAGGKAVAGGMLGGLLGGAGAQEKSGGSFGDLLNQALSGQGEPQQEPTQAQNAAAALMLRAMIQAAKSDGKIDEAERSKLLDNLGDVSPEEREFVQNEMQAPVDVAGLANQVPKGLEQQVYTMSVMAIDLDNQNEAKYLDALAQNLSINHQSVNAIHQQLGVPTLYT